MSNTHFNLARGLAVRLLLALILVPAGRSALAQVAPPVAKAPTAPAASITRSYEDWQAACARLPSNRSLGGRLPPARLLPLPRFAELDAVLEAFFDVATTGALAQASNWIGPVPGTNTFFNRRQAYFLPGGPIPFEPFAQKLALPPDSEVFFRGDLHGDVASLMANLAWLNTQGYLRGFTIARTNFHMVFLGDYTDRGAYGIEVLYTILRLKIANPDRVFMARGNHEEVNMQARYGFHQEGQGKYGAAFNPARIGRALDFLPVVIYVGAGTNFIQCNHGGMEPGFRPRVLLESGDGVRFQLLGALLQKRFLAEHPEAFSDAASRQAAELYLEDFRPESPTSPVVMGFMWNDFTVQLGEAQYARDPYRAYVYGDRSTAALLRSAGGATRQVHAVFRGHQHSSAPNPMMRRLIASQGLFRHWQPGDTAGLTAAPVAALTNIVERSSARAIPTGSVWTFNVGADSVYGAGCDYSFDTFGLLTMAPQFPDWRVRVVNVPLKP